MAAASGGREELSAVDPLRSGKHGGHVRNPPPQSSMDRPLPRYCLLIVNLHAEIGLIVQLGRHGSGDFVEYQILTSVDIVPHGLAA